MRKLLPDEMDSWYKENLSADFPVNEIKPLDNIKKLNRDGRYDIYVYEVEGRICGYATIWKRSGFKTYLLDYLGVPENMRNKGTGKVILAQIREQLVLEENKPDLCMILESETPEDINNEVNNLRRRRTGFYKRNGFIEIYEMGTCGVRFTTFSYKYPPEDLERTMKEHKLIYGYEREDVIVPLAPGVIPPLPFWMKEEV